MYLRFNNNHRYVLKRTIFLQQTPGGCVAWPYTCNVFALSERERSLNFFGTIQCSPLIGSTDNGSIRIMVQVLVSPIL